MALPIGGLLETALYAEDLDAADAFYGGVLELTAVTKVEGRHIFFRCGEGMLLIFNPQQSLAPPAEGRLPVPVHGAQGAGHACFRADGAAIERIAAALTERGIAIEADFRWPNGARSIYFRDPAGNSLECAEPALWDF